MPTGLILGVWGAVTILALITSTISLWLHFRTGSVHELNTQVRQLALDLDDVYDTVEKWSHRQAVRNMRAGKQAAALNAQPLTPQPGTPEYKSWLRSKAKTRGTVQ